MDGIAGGEFCPLNKYRSILMGNCAQALLRNLSLKYFSCSTELSMASLESERGSVDRISLGGMDFPKGDL